MLEVLYEHRQMKVSIRQLIVCDDQYPDTK